MGGVCLEWERIRYLLGVLSTKKDACVLSKSVEYEDKG